MALKKFATVLLMEIFILPVILEARSYHRVSYRQYYDDHSNSEQLEYPKISEESYYDHGDVKEEINLRFGDDRHHTNFDKTFVFPDDTLQTRNGDSNYVNVLSPVAKCNNMQQTFCEDAPNYPHEFVNQALAKNSSLFHYAHEDVLSIAPRTDSFSEEPLCLSIEQIIRPKIGQNLKNEWHYILQSNEANFYQSVRIETCEEENAKCKMIDGFAVGYVTMCKQKYIYRELSAISEKGEIIRDYFHFPASCCCHVQFKVNNEDGNEDYGVLKTRIREPALQDIPQFQPRMQ